MSAFSPWHARMSHVEIQVFKWTIMLPCICWQVQNFFPFPLELRRFNLRRLSLPLYLFSLRQSNQSYCCTFRPWPRTLWWANVVINRQYHWRKYSWSPHSLLRKLKSSIKPYKNHTWSPRWGQGELQGKENGSHKGNKELIALVPEKANWSPTKVAGRGKPDLSQQLSGEKLGEEREDSTICINSGDIKGTDLEVRQNQWVCDRRISDLRWWQMWSLDSWRGWEAER